jgi:hypothetical protein
VSLKSQNCHKNIGLNCAGPDHLRAGLFKGQLFKDSIVYGPDCLLAPLFKGWIVQGHIAQGQTVWSWIEQGLIVLYFHVTGVLYLPYTQTNRPSMYINRVICLLYTETGILFYPDCYAFHTTSLYAFHVSSMLYLPFNQASMPSMYPDWCTFFVPRIVYLSWMQTGIPYIQIDMPSVSPDWYAFHVTRLVCFKWKRNICLPCIQTWMLSILGCYVSIYSDRHTFRAPRLVCLPCNLAGMSSTHAYWPGWYSFHTETSRPPI